MLWSLKVHLNLFIGNFFGAMFFVGKLAPSWLPDAHKGHPYYR